MRIHVVGGGPAGLYFALLMKKRDPSREIRVFERNAAGSTFGWGLVFSGKTLANLADTDRESYEEIEAAFARWDNVDVVHRGRRITVRGNRFAGIERIALLDILERRCRDLGVEVLHEARVDDPAALPAGADLLVGADGVHSTVRETWKAEFGPEMDRRPNRYIWLGTPRLFHGLTLIFRSDDAGAYAAHAYKYGPDRSTFIVECPPETWERAGFGAMEEDGTMERLQEVFADDLQGMPLLSNNSRWLQFIVLRNARWSRANVVLLGDALHTAHFSIGSGTKLALEDAISLAAAFDESGAGIRSVLEAFEAARRPEVEKTQRAAGESMLWFEGFERHLDLDPLSLAYEVMTRSNRVDHENLRKRDPEFVSRYEALHGG